MENIVKDMEFSEEFMHDIAKVMEQCANNNTDSCSVKFDINGKTLLVDFTFKIK